MGSTTRASAHGVDLGGRQGGSRSAAPARGLPVWAAALIGIGSTFVIGCILAAVAIPVVLDLQTTDGALTVRLPGSVAGYDRVTSSYTEKEARSFASDADSWARSVDTAGYGSADAPEVMVYAGALSEEQVTADEEQDLDDAEESWRKDGDEDDQPAGIHDVKGTDHLAQLRCASFDYWVECVGSGPWAYVDVYVDHTVADAERTALDLAEQAFVSADDEPSTGKLAAG